MNKTTTIIIIIFVVILVVIFGAYSFLRKNIMIPEDFGIITPPVGPPDFPTSTPIPTQTPKQNSTEGSELTPDFDTGSDFDFIPIPPPYVEPELILSAPIPTLSLGTETLTINTASGLIEINNVLLNPEKVLAGGWGVVVKRTPQYSMVYYEKDQGFVMTVEDIDVEAARSTLEWDFLTTLGISPEDACKLNVTLSVPGDINIDLSGINYGLSFCPNGIAF